jgi:hypothetical protein
MRNCFGGRIETWTLDLNPHGRSLPFRTYNNAIEPDQKRNFYRAEFGPMKSSRETSSWAIC